MWIRSGRKIIFIIVNPVVDLRSHTLRSHAASLTCFWAQRQKFFYLLMAAIRNFDHKTLEKGRVMIVQLNLNNRAAPMDAWEAA